MFGWLTKGAYRKRRQELNVCIRHYLEMHTRGRPDLAKSEDVTACANDALLDEDDILGTATASLADPSSPYSPEAVRLLLKLLMTVTTARGMSADYFLVMQDESQARFPEEKDLR